MSTGKVPIGVLLSGSGTNLAAILEALSEPDHPAEVVVVISNRENAYGLERARQAGIPAVFVAHKGKNRTEFDSHLVKTLRDHGVQWVVLAGFMRLLSPVFLDAFHARVLNIHPALLPSFPGIQGQGQAFDYGVRISGATVHLVDGGTDTGPIIAQGATPVLGTDTPESLKERILQVEHQLYPRVIRWAAEGRIMVEGRKTWLNLPEGEVPYLWHT